MINFKASHRLQTFFPALTSEGKPWDSSTACKGSFAGVLSCVAGSCRYSRCPPGTPEPSPGYLRVCHPSGAVTTITEHIRVQMNTAGTAWDSVFHIPLIFSTPSLQCSPPASPEHQSTGSDTWADAELSCWQGFPRSSLSCYFFISI